MSIVKALNELSGKEANTIEKAIRNIELGGGGGGGAFIVNVQAHQVGEQAEVDSYDKTLDEILEAYDDGKNIVAKVVLEGEPESVMMPLYQASAGDSYKTVAFSLTMMFPDDYNYIVNSVILQIISYNGQEQATLLYSQFSTDSLVKDEIYTINGNVNNYQQSGNAGIPEGFTTIRNKIQELENGNINAVQAAIRAGNSKWYLPLEEIHWDMNQNIDSISFVKTMIKNDIVKTYTLKITSSAKTWTVTEYPTSTEG